jgi:hypothetical protein
MICDLQKASLLKRASAFLLDFILLCILITGFAFGLGLTRLAMMKYGVKDIRDLNSGSLVAMEQFTDDV